MIREKIVPFAKSIKNEWYEIDVDMCKSRLDEVLDCWDDVVASGESL